MFLSCSRLNKAPRPPPASSGSRGSAGGGCYCRHRRRRRSRRSSVRRGSGNNDSSGSSCGSSSNRSSDAGCVPVEPLLQRRGDFGRGSRGRGRGSRTLPFRVEVELALPRGLQDCVPLDWPRPRPGGHRSSCVAIAAAITLLTDRGRRRRQIGLGGDEGRKGREGEGGVCCCCLLRLGLGVIEDLLGKREADNRGGRVK